MKKLLSIFLSGAMLLSLVPAAFAAGESADSPIDISTAAELTSFAESMRNDSTGGSGKFYRLTADINLDAVKWGGIGTNSNPFRGTFDGNGHVIKNYKMTPVSDSYTGLFSYVGEGGTVKNLGVDGVTIAIADKWCYRSNNGGIAGYVKGGTISGCYAKNVTLSNGGYSPNESQLSAGAGVVGMLDGSGSTVENCYALNIKVNEAETNYDAGLVGKITSGAVIKNCYTDLYLARGPMSVSAENSYYTVTPPWPWASGDGNEWYMGTQVTASELKTKAADLGDAFSADSVISPINGGYPVLRWEYDIPALVGGGTRSNPYLIGTIDDLALASGYIDTNGKVFKMISDIDFGGAAWTANIGSESNPFKGTFDGDGHVFKNFVLNAPAQGDFTYGLGIFAYVGGNAVIKDTGVSNVTVRPEGNWGFNTVSGGLIGVLKDNATVKRCFAKNVSFEAGSAEKFIYMITGGLIGKVEGSGASVTDCYSLNTEVVGDCSAHTSGLIGQALDYNTISNCYSNTTLTMGDSDKVLNSYYIADGEMSAYNRLGESVTSDELKGKAGTLGEYFEDGSEYPILIWENGKDIEDTLETVYINSAEEFKAISTDTASDGKIYKLNCDIDFGGETYTDYIGTPEVPFTGVFDGCGHKISNYHIKITTIKSNGLFANIGASAVIKNVGVSDVTAELAKDEWEIICGGLVGSMTGASRVENCYAKNVEMTSNSFSSGQFQSGGGVVGKAFDEASVVNCYALNTTFINEVNFDAGVIGYTASKDVKIENCYSDYTLTCYRAPKLIESIINSYYVTTAPWPWQCAYNVSATNEWYGYIGQKTDADAIKTMSVDLGNGYIRDAKGINGGYPVLLWESTSDYVSDVTFKAADASAADFENAAVLSEIELVKKNSEKGIVAAAAYKDGRLTAIEFTDAVDGKSEFNLSLDGADTLKIMILTKDSFKPIGEKKVFTKAAAE